MTDTQIKMANALIKCTFPIGSGQKRFAHSMHSYANDKPETKLTDKQDAYLSLLFHQYRRQISHSHTLLCDCEEAKAKRAQMVMVMK
jgi:hypothetical protein